MAVNKTAVTLLSKQEKILIPMLIQSLSHLSLIDEENDFLIQANCLKYQMDSFYIAFRIQMLNQGPKTC